ncbi:MAG: hypothetical protein ACRDWX_08805 [Acidimicrobiia bacterium]
MLASIHPLGERARHSRWGITVSAYLAGSVAGGALAGGVLGLAGELVGSLLRSGPQLVAVVVLLVGATGVPLDLGWGRLPTIRRQVNEDWLARYRGWVYGAGFGFQLGLGVVTIVSSAAVYVTFALALLAGSFPAGLAIGGTFGLVRGSAVLAAAHVREPGQLRALHGRIQQLAPLARGAAAAGLALLAAVGSGALV